MEPNPALRRAAISRILRQSAVGRQAELVSLLRREGFDATQSSVSRDLRELGVAKAHDRYLLPASRTPSRRATSRRCAVSSRSFATRARP